MGVKVFPKQVIFEDLQGSEGRQEKVISFFRDPCLLLHLNISTINTIGLIFCTRFFFF